MTAEYLSLIVSISQMAQRAIELKTSNNNEERRELTMHYRNHSKLLATALLQWGRRMNFLTCEYKDGELLIQDPAEVDQPTIPYLEDLMKHLEKSYKFILTTHRGIETGHKELCEKINKVMCYGISVVPFEPSYEHIIVSKIKQKCFELRRTDKKSLRENNVFLAPHIFDLIFEKISLEKSEIGLSIER